ncbi:LacI family DNA-binding transcriptional regulator [Agromyces atrinae]|uniref:DNA-binding LacI/PurR family transcriptional regulator n=1 Tax=Agromyces atrinae TaxID=592376 RepID=A0A4Q2MDA7_9MICO|nr:substrate-binding domain-containing protein [Agromyces atrinae]NYD67773.1 DNA-binding LacI/PurR family transcriptional regulator [Agromyces atrinae]RXZ88042.1 LacI family transcriptional regulator [Agromyces atrinae]
MSNLGHQPALLVDVAAEAGVSVSTVSRVLSGRVPVSKSLHERVTSAVQRLGYRPNAAAQALVSGRRSTVAVLARNTLRYGYAATLQGVEEAARAAGFVVSIAVVESDDAGEISRAVDTVLSQPIAGAIVIEFDSVGVQIVDALPQDVRVVAAAGARRRGAPRPHAFLDDYAGGFEATEYLLSLGHSTVHHIAIPSTRARSGRAWGWRRALEKAGAPVPPMIQAAYHPSSGHDAAIELVDDADVTAILCGNDEIAIGVARAYQEAGREIPRDISIMGFDDQPFAAMWYPALSTVSQDFVELGRRTFGLLHGWVESGTQPSDSSSTPTLIVRESTAAPRPAAL